jgi:nucleoside-diphosphate-sugar epimerase
MRILITGGAGFIGSHLADALLAAGHDIIVLDDLSTGSLANLTDARKSGRCQVVEGRVEDLAVLAPLVAQVSMVFHLAAAVGVDLVVNYPVRTIETNVHGSEAVFRVAAEHKCRVLLASTSEVYGRATSPQFKETDDLVIGPPTHYRWSYAASKIAGESAVFGAAKLGGFTPIVVRFHNVYGPRMGPTHVIPEFLARARAKVDPFPVFGADQTRSFLHVDDAARALRAVLGAALEGKGGLYNIGSDRETLIADLAKLVFDVSGFHPKVDARPAPPGSVRRRVPDTRKLRSLGFAPQRELREGITECWQTLAR